MTFVAATPMPLAGTEIYHWQETQEYTMVSNWGQWVSFVKENNACHLISTEITH